MSSYMQFIPFNEKLQNGDIAESLLELSFTEDQPDSAGHKPSKL